MDGLSQSINMDAMNNEQSRDNSCHLYQQVQLQGQSECHICSSQGLGTEFNYNNMHDGLTVHQVNFYMYKCWANFTNKKLQAAPRKPTTLMRRLVVLHICYYSYTSPYHNFLY